MTDNKAKEILDKVKPLAIEYYKETKKPLGVTGEIAEYEAAKILNLDLCAAREPGCDAIQGVGDEVVRYQIKGRWVHEDSKKSQRVGRLRFDHPWDFALLVLLDENLEVFEIWQADRDALYAALMEPGSKSRNERGALGIPKFKATAELVWFQDKA